MYTCNLLQRTLYSYRFPTRYMGTTRPPRVRSSAAGRSAAAKFRKLHPQWGLTLQVPDELLFIPMDAVLIEQVLLNLMENAVHHAQGGDRITVTLTRRDDRAVFEVRDNGAGIDPALLPKIFHTHLPAEDRADSTRRMGIGLSVCHAILSAHGGTITAENAPEGGAVFRFTLPLEVST